MIIYLSTHILSRQSLSTHLGNHFVISCGYTAAGEGRRGIHRDGEGIMNNCRKKNGEIER
jgi:hypothetical protein